MAKKKQFSEMSDKEMKAEIVRTFFEFLRDMFLVGLDNKTINDEKAIKFFIGFIKSQVLNCMEIGQDKGLIPVFNISVWAKPLSFDAHAFQYRLDTVGGEPYKVMKLDELATKMKKLLEEWSDVTYNADLLQQWGSVLKGN